jgi:hypothetical protein
MPQDRKADRHKNNKDRHLVSFPPGLYDDLKVIVGEGNCSATLSELTRRYLAGEPMLPRPGKQGKKPASPGRGERQRAGAS